jgi:hypothetical protein
MLSGSRGVIRAIRYSVLMAVAHQQRATTLVPAKPAAGKVKLITNLTRTAKLDYSKQGSLSAVNPQGKEHVLVYRQRQFEFRTTIV